MADDSVDWFPLPEVKRKDSSSEDPPKKMDMLWEKFANSSLSSPDYCGCCTSKKLEVKVDAPCKAAVMFEPLQSHVRLSEALLSWKPQFVKESQLRTVKGRSNNGNKLLKAKTRKTHISEEERLQRMKSEAARNRIRVRLFQKEVLNQLHFSQRK